MPIEGITDQDPRFNQIGELRKGAPKEQGRPGEDLDYFRFTSDEPGLEQQFREAYGEEPREIPISLPYPTVDECFDAWLEEWGRGSLKRRCTGREQVLWQENGQFVRAGEEGVEPKPCLQSKGACDCQRNARLQVWLPKLNRLGVVLVLTSSLHDIKNLHGSLKRCEQIAQQMGMGIQGIPMVLKRVKKKVSTPSGKGNSRTRRTFWLLFVEPQEEWVEHQLEEARARQMQPVLTGETESPRLPEGGRSAPEAVNAETGEVVVVDKEEERSELEQASREGEPDFELSDLEALIEAEHPGDVREAAIAASDFGFAADTRDLRLAFTELLVGHELDSYKQDPEEGKIGLEKGEGEYVANAINLFNDFLSEHGADSEQSHIWFAKWVIGELPEKEQELLQKKEYLRPIAKKFLQAHSG